MLCRDAFELPDGIVYLDGNSLGPLPKGARERAMKTIEHEWGQELIRAWNSADWIGLPTRVGDRIARLIGAAPGTVATGDTLSLKVYQALAAALPLRPERKVILSDTGNFPTDLYMADGLAALMGQGHRVVTVAPEAVEAAITEDVAALLLTHVDYRTGRMHDMARLTEKCAAVGAIIIWDLAHSAGALDLDLAGLEVDFAVGCTYKFLNGGPGAPAFIYARPDHVADHAPTLAGWMGHAAPFAMERGYRPADGAERLRIGTPPVVQLSILDAALDVWDGLDLADIRRASLHLSELFIAEVEARCPMLSLASPRDGHERGSQVSFRHPEGYRAVRALIDRGVIGDFRPPDIMRFGITPLYVTEADILSASKILADVMAHDLWRAPEYKRVARVT
ncbi:MAG: kynureninase [Pseudomonadota bacterium]